MSGWRAPRGWWVVPLAAGGLIAWAVLAHYVAHLVG